jgi:glycosyltransferase involved in cell wall biosynthesis/ubiquinone/menaquinone biosynthesis C-methylase UbiE
MKILYVLPEASVAGGASQVFEHVNRLIDRGHDVKLAILSNNVYKVNWYPLKTELIPMQDIPALAKKMDIVVATHYITSFFVHELETKAKKYYFVQHKESWFVDELSFVINDFEGTEEVKKLMIKERVKDYRAYIEKSYRLMDLNLFTTSDWLLGILDKEFDRTALQVYCCLNDKMFYPEPMFPRNDGKIRVLLETTTQSTSWKGLDDAIAVLEGDPELRKEIEVWTLSADDPKYTGDKHWKNPTQDEIRQIYSSSDINLKMSWYEGWGLGPMQAMACGCAVVTSDNFGINTYGHHGINCLIVGNRDIKEARNQIVRLIKDKKLRNKLIKNGLEINKQFVWDKEIDKLEKEFSSYRNVEAIDVVEEIMEFKKEPKELVVARLNEAPKLLEQEWIEKNPQTDKDIIKFYQETENYIYDLTAVNQSEMRISEYNEVKEMIESCNSKRHLDFGGGTADLLLRLHEYFNNKIVLYYFDVNGKTKEFAKWRIALRGYPIITDTEWEGITFDSISAIDVLEHVTNPEEIIAKLASMLVKGGKIYIAAPFEATVSNGFHYPMHLESNMKYSSSFDEIVAKYGLTKISNRIYIKS